MKEPVEQRLHVVCDGLRLPGGAFVPDSARAVVVLLHGIPSTAPRDPDDEGYPGFARRLAARGLVAAWADMRAARGAPGYFSIEAWVRDAGAIVDAARSLEGAAGLPTAIVGSSAGGSVAVEATRRGAPVEALVLLAAPATWTSFADAPGEGLRRITEEAGMALAPHVLDDPGPWAKEFERVTTELSISALEIPVLVVHGTADDVVPVEHARRIAGNARAAELEIIPGGEHQLRRNPDAVALVIDWLDRRFP